MIVITDKVKCTGCHACDNICPVDAIIMKHDEEGFWYPSVLKNKCVHCNLCNKICPLINENKEVKSKQNAYAAYNKNDEIRLKSSSGGIFTELSRKVLENNGLVFGAAFDKDMSVIHKYVDDIKDIHIFRGSKYVQSNINITFKQVKEFLEEGKEVLFSGTPCQIGGLKAYLGKNYKNLICVDIICHGVPSPKVWKKYINEISDGKKIIGMTFRDKSKGWSNGVIKYFLEDGTEYIENYNESKYIKGFIKNCYLRPSCYNCKYKTLNRESDITLADFWGIEDIIPDMNDNKGTSLCIIHSEKGEKIFLELSENVNYKYVDLKKAILYNICAVKSVELNDMRGKFFKYNKKMSVSNSINKATKVSEYNLLIQKIQYYLHRIIDKSVCIFCKKGE